MRKPSATAYGGIDIGGTKTHAIVTDEIGNILGAHTVPTGTGSDAVVAGALASVWAAAARAGVDPIELRSVGVGIPGRVDPLTRIVSHAVNLGVVELELGDLLSAELGVPVAVDNDVKASSLGAARHLGADTETISYLNFGTGLAMSTVHAGQIWRGSSGFAGEIGHLPLTGSGITCPCGQTGCLETIASGAGMLRRWQVVHPAGTAADLDAAATNGDPLAWAIWQDMVNGAALTIEAAVLAIDPALVAIGGGVAHGRPDLIAKVAAHLDAAATQSPFLASLGISSRIRLIPASAQVAVTGAVLLGRSGSATSAGTAR